jgi:hypothetical protein
MSEEVSGSITVDKRDSGSMKDLDSELIGRQGTGEVKHRDSKTMRQKD